MIPPERIYSATNDGLAILALHYPEVTHAAEHNKPFKARPGERTPSARVRLMKTKSGVSVWKLTDFGGEGRAIDPIEVHMNERNLTFVEAVLDIASIFNISDELNRTVNRPDVRKQPASPDQPDGSCFWDIDQHFTESECKVMGPRVKAEHLKSLNWFRVNFIATVKNGEVTYKYSNPHYPIFMRECQFTNAEGSQDSFYKIYEPLNIEKQWRFQYQPKGKKPQSYINGLPELSKVWADYNNRLEKEFYADPRNEDKTFKSEKLPEAIICSGERDSLCVASLGYHPLWFNSETYQVSEDEIRQISKYVDTIYNIPDIDATGKKKGAELALKYIDIHTVWLPEKLTQYRDHRGNPRKDFRDWMEIWKNKRDFSNLLELALPAKFWTVSTNEKSGVQKYAIDISCMREFLTLNGFYVLKDEYDQIPRIVRIKGHIVEIVTPPDVRNFVFDWTLKTAQPRLLRNLVLKTPELGNMLLETLAQVNLDFSNFTEKSQFFFFPNFAVEVTGKSIIRYDNREGADGHYVWADSIIDHNIRIAEDDIFRITYKGEDNAYRSEDFDIEIRNTNSNYFKYLINSSRIYWRKELETELQSLDPEEAEAYRKAHRFDICGPNLNEDEIAEQKQCLISKIFTIGYMMHRYKRMDRAWAPFVMDNIIGESDQCNGRSGKSFMFWTLRHFTKWLKMSGRQTKQLEGQFAFEQVNRHQGIVLIDDCDEYFPFKLFYDNITSDMTINPKNVSAYQLDFFDAPKFAFTTNYVPKEFSGSSVGRMLFVVFSDYYHEKAEDNDYLETRKISSDFGRQLFDRNYPEAAWEADINFLLQCVRFYLSVADTPAKIEPRMSNIIFRKFLRDMSDNFKDWAEGYFALGSDHLDQEIVREKAFDDYKRFSGLNKISMQTFSKSLRGFCYTCEYIDELNPEEMHNSGSRILRRIDDGSGKKIQKEMIYIRTKKGYNTKISDDVNALFGDDDPFASS